MPAAFAARTTSATLSGPPMLPGLIRTAATPASIAFNARLALKWISAITGIGDSRTIRFSASASSVFGTAQRTTSQPALASAAIWAVVASTSCVFVSVMDCTTTGAPPPISTPPTLIWRALAIRGQCIPGLSGRSARAEPVRVVREADHEEQGEDGDPDRRRPLVDLAADGPAAEALDQREDDVAAVERQQRKQVEDAEGQAEEAEEADVVLEALTHGGVGGLDDADRAVQLAVPLRQVDEEADDPLDDRPGLAERVLDSGAE